MSLNFYAGIDNFKIDSKDNTNISLKIGSGGLANQLDLLRQLKGEMVVHILVDSAQIDYTEKVDVENDTPLVTYKLEQGFGRGAKR